MLRTHIGQALYKERTAQNRTLRDVAGKAIISTSHLSEAERGIKELSSEYLQYICNALYISVGELMIDVTTSLINEEERIRELQEV